MRAAFWARVVADGCRVPDGPALDELTGELVAMLGEADPDVREGLAVEVLSTWIGAGVYDELLAGLGDGLVPGLRAGLGEEGTDSVLGRAACASVLRAAVDRDNRVGAVHPATLLGWADRSFAWLLAERDLRPWVPGGGRAQAVGRGADLLATLAASRHFGRDELAVLLDVVADRLLTPTAQRLGDGEEDRLALATMSVLHRNVVTGEALEGWLDRLETGWRDAGVSPQEAQSAGGGPGRAGQRGGAVRANVVGYLRALHLQLLIGVTGTPTQPAGLREPSEQPLSPPPAPAVRADLLIALQRALRRTAPGANLRG